MMKEEARNLNKWGYLAETSKKAKLANLRSNSDLNWTGLDDYLKFIFPKVNDWVFNKSVPNIMDNGKRCRSRPDCRSDKQRLIIEVDGTPHYKSPSIIRKDMHLKTLFEKNGYKVVRIPYFIQLTEQAVKTLFGVSVGKPLFDGSRPSLGVNENNLPAFLCPAGIERMAKEFLRFPEQYKTNIDAIEKMADPELTGVDLLKKEYEAARQSNKTS